MTTTNITTEPAGVGVTIKYGKGYEETWLTLRGTVESVREDLIAYFGVDRASVTTQTLSELVVNCTSIAHGKGNVAAYLGAVVLGEQPVDTSAGPATDEGQAGDVWAQAASNTPVVSPVYALIAAATDVDALKVIWAENQDAFADAEVTAAWKARGKSFQSA